MSTDMGYTVFLNDVRLIIACGVFNTWMQFSELWVECMDTSSAGLTTR